MKYFKAISYTFLMSFLFFTTIIMADGIHKARALTTIINEALEEENFHLLLRGKYQSVEPFFDEVLETEDFKLTIKGYETVDIIDDELVLYTEYIIIVDEGELSSYENIEMDLVTNQETIPVWLLKYLTLEVYILVSDPTTNSLLTLDEILPNVEDTINAFEIRYSENGENIKEVEIVVNQDQDNFVFEETLNVYYNTNNAYPLEDTNNIKVRQIVEVNSTKVLIITGLITLSLIGLLTYYLYIVKPKRKLGKKETTINLEKDIEKLKEKQKQ